MSNSTICRRMNAESLLLMACLMLGAVVLPAKMILAEELTANTLASIVSEPAAAGKITVYQGEEVYGLSKLAMAAEKMRTTMLAEESQKGVSFIVAGEVSNPGEYCLRSPVNLLTAILAAGGPSADGSMRRVEVYQGGTLLGEFDLYSFLSEGRIAGDFIFNGGEQIVLLPCGPRVSISGSVKVPAVFELKNGEMTLGRLLELAGGFSSGSGLHHVEVVRIADSQQRVAFSADIEDRAGIPDCSLEPGDRIRVLRKDLLHRSDVYVQLPKNIFCNVNYRPGMKISELIGRLQPLPDNVSLRYAEILREGRLDKKYDVIGISIDLLMRQIAHDDTSNDLILFPGDRLMLFDREFLDKRPVVGVEVQGQPLMLVEYRPGMTVCDLLESVNAKLPDKKFQSAVYRRQLTGSKLDVVRLVVDINAARNRNQRHNIELQPFDTLLIKH